MNIPEHVYSSLSDSDKQEFEIWQELLDSRGFKMLKDFLANSQEAVDATIQNAQNWDSYVFARGQRDALYLVLNLEEVIEQKVLEIVDTLEAAQEEEAFVMDEIEVNLR